MILRLKEVEILLDTIAQLADREFILLTWLRRTLKHRIKTWGSARFRSKKIFYSTTPKQKHVSQGWNESSLPPRHKKYATILRPLLHILLEEKLQLPFKLLSGWSQAPFVFTMVQQWYGFRGVVKDEHLAARASFTFYRGNKVFFARWRKIYIYIYFFFHSLARKNTKEW